MAKTKTAEKVNELVINKAFIRGVIVHITKTPEFLTTTISTSLRKGIRDYPSIFWYGDRAETIYENYKVGDHVTINAHVQTSKKYRSQYIVGDEIKTTSRELEEKLGVDVGRYLIDKNEATLSGKFLRSYMPNGEDGQLAIITIKTEQNGHINFPQITCFGNMSEAASKNILQTVSKMQPDDMVCFVGHVQTDKKETEQGAEYFQSIVSHYAEIL